MNINMKVVNNAPAIETRPPRPSCSYTELGIIEPFGSWTNGIILLDFDWFLADRTKRSLLWYSVASVRPSVVCRL